MSAAARNAHRPDWQLLSPSVALLIGVLAANGCEPQVRITRDGWIEWATKARLSVERAPTQERQSGPAADAGSWSISLERFAGADRHQRAEALLHRLSTETSVSNLWINDLDSFAVVCHGRFDDPAGAAAQAALRQIRSLELDGAKTYRNVGLAPLGRGGRQIFDTLDLKQFPGQLSLQVEFYNENYDGDFRRAAEGRARALRRSGEQAYYYHGPHISMVTLGLFSRDDFVKEGDTDAYGPRIKAIQEEYPYNLANGWTLVEKVRGKAVGEQPSFLVRVW